MSQTSYSRSFVNAFSGMLGDSGFKYIQTRVNASGVDLPAGIGVASTSTEGNATVISSAATAIEGIIVNSFARDPGSAGNALTGTNVIKSLNEMNLLSEGAIFVLSEQTVVVTDPVFMRIATSVNTGTLTQKGQFRKDSDGVAQVSTLTPTAVNSTLYVLRVAFDGKAQGTARESYTFAYTSDGSATATEIVTGFKTVMAADAAFTARVVATGTTTLILTGQVAGEAFTSQAEGDGAIAVAATTPAAPTARRVKAARWLKASDATSKVAMLYFSASADAL